ncbi:hypothetical protein Pelo_3243 [Pelomyxa schiedti]|nr:hypothetical protein Pelo_3243 [Pelomyxa schiedti]
MRRENHHAEDGRPQHGIVGGEPSGVGGCARFYLWLRGNVMTAVRCVRRYLIVGYLASWMRVNPRSGTGTAGWVPRAACSLVLWLSLAEYDWIWYKDDISVLSERQATDFWKYHGLSFILVFLLSPRLALFWHCTFPTYVSMVLSACEPYAAVVYLGWRRGYYTSNPILWWAGLVFHIAFSLVAGKSSLVGLIVKPDGVPPEVIESLTWIEPLRRYVGRLQEEVADLQNMNRYLRADNEMLQQMSSSQLQTLTTFIGNCANRIGEVTRRLASSSPSTSRTNSIPPEPISSGDCVVCMSQSSTVTMFPCLHLCVCTSCFDIYSRDSSSCPVCKCAVTHFSLRNQFAKNITPEQYHWESIETTYQELKKAGLWDKHQAALQNNFRL